MNPVGWRTSGIFSLNVSGCKSLDDSFRDYVQVETLEGENKYMAEGFGLQDAKKGVIFESFPNVLHLQLKRFEYDFNRDAMMKVNDRYEFPEIWDASPYLHEKADKSEPYIYHLHGVLVHSGDLNAGHYYAFLKPDKEGDFFRFDDDRVTRATKREATDENFGGDYAPNGVNGGLKGQNPYTRQWSTKRSNNAYMLVYIRESRLDDIILPQTDVQAPEHLPIKLAEERAALEKRKKEREEAHLYMNVSVASELNFRDYRGVDLILPWAGDDELDPAAPKAHRLLKSMTVADFTDHIARIYGADPELIRPWIMVNRQNGTVRPDQALTWPDMTLQEAADKYSTRNSGFRVFMEETTRDADGQPDWAPGDLSAPASPVVNGNIAQQRPILVFLKYFDVDSQTLSGVGHIYMNPLDKAHDLTTPILQMMRWQAGTEIELFEEIKQNYIEPLKPKQSLAASEIQDGDIICFQRHLTDNEQAAIKQTKPTACLSAPHFYDYLINRIYVTFTPRFMPMPNYQAREQDAETFQIALSKKDPYDVMALKAAEYLTMAGMQAVDPSHLRFSTVHIQSGKPKAVVKRQQNATMANILLGSTGYGGYGYAPTHATDQLYYEVLEMSLTDLEQRKNVRISWLTEGINKDEEFNLLVHKQSQFTEVLSALQKKASLPDELLDQIRFYETHSYKVYKVLPLSHGVLALNEFMTIYAERIPEEEQEMDKEKGDRLTSCLHFEKDPTKSHGIPFIFLVKEGEVFKETKERLSRRTGIKGKQFEKIRFAVVKGGQSYSRPVFIEDGE